MMPARRLIGQGWRKATWLRSAFDLLSRPVTVWLLGALLAFAGHPLYAAHAAQVSRHLPHCLPDLSPLQDQQLAGLIMWVPASLVQLVALGAVFADWLSISPGRRRTGHLSAD